MTPPWQDPRGVLRRHDLTPKRRMSQSFLVSQRTVERIASAAAPTPGGWIVELGPGVGTLTTALLDRGARVVAVERDEDMIRVLEAELGVHPDLVVLSGDAATVDIAALARERGGSPITVAGNLPYSATGAILRNLVAHRRDISCAVVMVQREVRDRLLSPPGTKAYGALTVFATAAFDVQPVLSVPARAFHPQPRVASAVVKLVPHAAPRAEETVGFRTVVRAAFEARRKTLRNALCICTGAAPERVEAALREAGIDGTRRGETLSVEEFAALGRAFGE